MSLLMENSGLRTVCGDPGDPIAFAALFDGGWLERVMTAASNHTELTIYFMMKGGPVAGDPFQTVLSAGTLNTPTAGYSILQVSAEQRMAFGQSNDNLTTSLSSSTLSVLRDYAGWSAYHIQVNTGVDGVGSQVTVRKDGHLLGVYNYTEAAAGYLLKLGSALRHGIGVAIRENSGNYTFPAKIALAEVCMIVDDLVPHNEFMRQNRYGQWVHKAFTGKGGGAAVYGANGFHMDFADGGDLGKDVSGCGNHFTVAGNVAQSIDTPTTNFATLDPVSKRSTAALREGNLVLEAFGTGIDAAAVSTIPAIYPGKFYCEVEVVAVGTGSSWFHVGVAGSDIAEFPSFGGPSGYTNYRPDGYIDAVMTTPYGDGAIVGVGIDARNGLINWYLDGVFLHTTGPFSWDTGKLYPMVRVANEGGSVARFNAGQRPFAHPVPEGYLPLCAANLPCPETLAPDTLVTVYEGAATSVDIPWNPLVTKTLILSDFLDETKDNLISDTVRGNNKPVSINSTAAEITTDPDCLSFRAGGYDIGTSTAYSGRRRDYIFRASRRSGMDILDPIISDGVTPITVQQLTGGAVHHAWFIPLDGGTRRMFHREMSADQYVMLEDNVGPQTDAGWFASTASDITVRLPVGRWLSILWTTKDQYSSFTKIIGDANGAVAPMDFTPRLAFFSALSAFPNGLHAVCADSSEGNPISKISVLYTGQPEVQEVICDMNSFGIKMRSTTFNPDGQELLVSAFALTPGKFATSR